MVINSVELEKEFSFLSVNSEIADTIRSINWSTSILGAARYWPQSLRTTLSIIMHSKFPIFILWGPNKVLFYNDALIPYMGPNYDHSSAIGKDASDCWAPGWHLLQPFIDKAYFNGITSWNEDQLIPIWRAGKMENVYWTYCYSLINDETDVPAGVFVSCFETTDKITSLKTINDSKNELEFAINAAELGTWDYDPNLDKLSINNRMKNWYGLELTREIDFALSLETIAPADRKRVVDAAQIAMQFSSGGRYAVDYTVINLVTKQERYVRAKGKVLFNDQQEPYRFNGVKMDITQERVSREALVESENKFRSLIAQSPVAICLLRGTDLRVTVANDLILQIWEKTEQQVINLPLFSVFPEFQLQFEAAFLQVYLTGARFTVTEVPLNMLRENANPELMYFNFIVDALKNKDGEIDGIMLVATDETNKVIEKLKADEAEERARLVLEAVNLGTYDFNITTGQFANSVRAREIIGVSSQLSREDYLLSIHPEDKMIQVNNYKQSLLTGELFYEVRVIWQDESIHWVRVEGKMYFDKNNIPARLLGTILDITQQRVEADELIKTNQRLAIALEVGQLGSYELDLITGEIEASNRFRINYGLSSTKPINYITVLNAILPQYAKAVKRNVIAAIKNKTVYNLEFPVKWPDNSIHWVKCSGKARYDNSVNAFTFIGVTADITALKKSQQQKDDFIGFASHELKTPVTSIKAYNQLMETILLQKGDTVVATMCNKIGVQVQRLNNLIADLLDITRINSGKLPVIKSSFNFGQLVNSIVDDIQNTTSKITIVADIAFAGTIESDKERIVQVITNLINNAIKYSPGTDKIIIQTLDKNDEFLFSVQDFGVGIAVEHQEKVFEQFYRVSGDMQHTFPGLGLGLYISAEIIKQLGGRIWIKNNVGNGVTFSFLLPKNGPLSETD